MSTMNIKSHGWYTQYSRLPSNMELRPEGFIRNHPWRMDRYFCYNNMFWNSKGTCGCLC